MPVRVLVVDDSAYMRQVIKREISAHPEIQVIATAKNGGEALLRIGEEKPDCVVLDMEMPILDGLGTVKVLMKEKPLPILLLTSLSRGHHQVVTALAKGAADFLQKPARKEDWVQKREELIGKILALSRASFPIVKEERSPVKAAIQKKVIQGGVVGLAASTGGPRAFSSLLGQFPAEFPWAIVVVQHFPEGFSHSLATHLAKLCSLKVKVAEEGEGIQQGVVYVGEGGKQLRVSKRNGQGVLHLTDEASEHRVAPAADYTFEDLSKVYGRFCIVVVLTGMGKDGQKGAAEVKRRGGRVLAQDEKSCVVYGMPRSVVDEGIADAVVPLTQLPEKIAFYVEQYG